MSDVDLEFRSDYLRTAALLGVGLTADMQLTLDVERVMPLFVPSFAARLQAYAKHYDVNTLVFGLSGDLDSAATLLLLSEAIKIARLPLRLNCFYAVTNFHPERARRVKRLVAYVNKDQQIVQLKNYHFGPTMTALQSALRSPTEGRISGTTADYYESLAKELRSAVIAIPDRETMGSHRPINTPISINRREYSNVIHEAMCVLRGHTARCSDKPAVVSTQEATEFLIHNFTTSDQLAAVGPIHTMPKTVVAAVFGTMLQHSNGILRAREWSYSLNQFVSFYPRYASIARASDGQMTMTDIRSPTSLFGNVTLNSHITTVPAKLLDGLREVDTETEAIVVPGGLQPFLDPFLHLFVKHGIEATMQSPEIQNSDRIRNTASIAAFLYCHARRSRLKDQYFIRVPRIA